MNEEAILERLKAVPPVQVSRDLAPVILQRIREETARTGSPRREAWFASPWGGRVWAAAAALILLLGGGVWWHDRGRDPGDLALDWLRKTQERDGSWSTLRWGGDRHFEVALTALSLMALLEPGPGPRDEPANRAAIDKATAYLIRSQQADGRFGPSFSSSPYNQGMATLALAKACNLRKDDAALRSALDRAVACIRASQYGDGGWGYEKEAHPASNLSITWWQIEALRMAAMQGGEGLQASLQKGLRWMAGVVSDDGSFGYQKSGDRAAGASRTLTAMGAMSLLDAAQAELMPPRQKQALQARIAQLAAAPGPDLDYYRRFFLSASLKAMAGESARHDLSGLRRELLAHQVRHGANTGSWRPDDQWSTSGGRVYATALATLSIQ